MRLLFDQCWCVGLFSVVMIGVASSGFASDQVPAATATPGQSPTIFSNMVLPPEEVSVNAKSAVLMDVLTGEVLLAHNPHLSIAPASLAKLLSLYVIFDALKHGKVTLEETVHISKKAWQTSGSKMFIEVNKRVSVEALLKGIAVVSGNDASVAMAEHLYGDTETFARVMNKYAENLGMTDSHFVNPHGLPAVEQLTTAYDMARLARSYVLEFPQALEMHSMQEYTYGEITQRNRNSLLKRDPTVDGLKTGWVVQSGYNLVTSANRNHHRLITVVLGARTPAIREQETFKLLTYGYQNFMLLPFAQAGEVLTSLPVWKGVLDSLPVVAAETHAMVIPREYQDRIKTTQVLPKQVEAPVEKGQVLGKLLVTVDADNMRSIPLLAGASIEPAGFFKSMRQQLFQNGFGSIQVWLVVAASVVSLFVVAAVVMVLGRKRRRRPAFRSRLIR